MNQNVSRYSRFLVAVLLLQASVSFLSPSVFAVELMVDMDVFDNLGQPGLYDVDVYGPDQIEAFFSNCKAAGVKKVYWRAQSQIASYPSRLNYSGADLETIRSKPDARHRGGGLAAKVGVAEEGGGIFQDVDTKQGRRYRYSAWVSGSTNSAVSLRVFDRETGQLIAESAVASMQDASFQELAVRFLAKGPVRVGVVSIAKSVEMDVFVVDDVSLASGNGRNLIENGGMEDVFMLVPKAWDAASANFLVLNGDVYSLSEEERKRIFPKAAYWMGLNDHFGKTQRNFKAALELYDPLAIAVREAHRHGIKLYAWFDPLDDGRRFLPPIDGWWVSRFHEDHPRFRLVDATGVRRWGQLCFGYPEVRAYKTAVVEELLGYGVDGIYIKTGWQHNFIWDGEKYDYSQFVYNDVALAEYEQRWGKSSDREYDLEKLKMVHGDFFAKWLWEASQVIHAAGKQLAFSMRHGNTLEQTLGSWNLDWRRLIEGKVIDEFMVEPRFFNERDDANKKYLETLDRQFGYASLCRKHGVKFGYDYYLTALMRKMHTDPQDVFVPQILSLAESSADFVGIYEAMHIDQHGCWPAMERIGKELSTLSSKKGASDSPAEEDALESRENLLKAEGTTAVVHGRDFKRNAPEILDGNVGDTGSIAIPGVPFGIEIDLPRPVAVRSIRIFPGNIACANNPSGECGIKGFRVQGKVESGEWVDLCDPVRDLPRMRDTDALTEYDFFHEQELAADRPVVAVRVLVDESTDTGKRINGGVVPMDQKMVYIREIELF